MEKESHALVDGLFCICRPESLLLVSGCARNDEFIKSLCEKLVQIENAATNANCWQHHLKGVKIQHCGRKGYNKTLTCEAFLDSLQTLEPKEKILFLFEWMSQKSCHKISSDMQYDYIHFLDSQNLRQL
ncbi:hypothetical protein NC651_037726 [Populus alba x Populus x berolinensis]|nr:hypothetical protein NC651_037726 [Populus alba x Populus x berolinensis]